LTTNFGKYRLATLENLRIRLSKIGASKARERPIFACAWWR